MNAITRLKQDKIAIYMCTFQLKLSQLNMILKFPCTFFVQWKTSNNTKCVRTSKVYEAQKNQVLFDQTLTLQTQMIYDQQRKRWIRKNTVICVNVITKNKPDQNKQAGRICVDLVDIIELKKYQKPSSQALNYCSISAQLNFCMNLKYSLRVQIQSSKLDLSSFADYICIQQSSLNKSKSLDFLKKRKVQILERIDSVGEIQQNERQQKQSLRIGQNKIKSIQDIENVKQCLSSQEEGSQNQNQNQKNIRMTIGSSKQTSKVDYNLLIQKQSQGMRKSDLMIIPKLATPRGQVQHNQSSERSQLSQNQYSNNNKIIDKRQYKTNQNLSSDEKLPSLNSKKTIQRLNSVVKIAYDQQSSPSYPSLNRKFMKNSNCSDKSSSLKNFKGQKSPTLNKEPQNNSNNQQQLQGKNKRIKQLQADMSELVKMITNVNEQLAEQNQKRKNVENELKNNNKKLGELQQKLSYEQKINNMNLQRMKQLTNKLQNQKQGHKRKLSNVDQLKIMGQLEQYKNKCKKLQKSYSQLREKINKRDQIQLQNEQKIMMLNQQNQKLKQQIIEKMSLSPTSSVKSRAQVIKLQAKIQSLEEQNRKMFSKSQLYKKMIQEFMQRQIRMQNNIHIMEGEFIRLATEFRLLQLNKKQPSISMLYSKKIQLLPKRMETQAHSRQTSIDIQQMSFTKNEMKSIFKAKQIIKDHFNAKYQQFQKQSITQKQFRTWILRIVQILNVYVEQLSHENNQIQQKYLQKQQLLQKQLQKLRQKHSILENQVNLNQQKRSQNSAFQPQYNSNLQYLSPQMQKLQLYSQTTTRKPSLINSKRVTQVQLQREIQKLKSIIYDKSREMSDLTASYEKVKLQNEKQSVIIKNIKQQIGVLSNDSQKNKLLQTLEIQTEREEEFVHDILDLQMKLQKQKIYSTQIQEELSVRKSLNRSQQVSHLKDNNSVISDGLSVYKQIQKILKQRKQEESSQNIRVLIQNQNTLKEKLYFLEQGYQIKYIVEEKARNISKQLQKVKSTLIKMKMTELQNKSIFANILKPCQTSVADLLAAIQNFVNHPTD